MDYTAYDKSIAGGVVYRYALDFYTTAGAPEQVSCFLAHTVAFAPLVLPNGSLVTRYSGHPSGELLTTMLNSFVSLYAWRKACKQNKVPFSDLLLRVSGDDAVVALRGAITADLWPKMLECLYHHCNQTAKCKGMEDAPFPPGFHAPFLGRVTTVTESGVVVTFP